MTEKELQTLINSIKDLDQPAMEEAQKRQDSLAKPPQSLGLLEEISVQMAGITGQIKNQIKRTCVLVLCADNGVVAEGVSSAPKSVTLAQTMNFTRRLTGVGALAKGFESDLLIVDVGIDGDVPAELYTDSPFFDANNLNTHKIINRSIQKGTKNLANESAMTRQQTLRAIEIGVEMARAIKETGYSIFGIGEMGIGNTTTSAAILSALTGKPAETTVGKGGGITDKSFRKKQQIVKKAVKRCEGKNPLDILTEVGGFDLAAMTGAFLSGAADKMPMVIDGYISMVAALTAARMAPKAAQYMFSSHQSYEQGYETAREALGAHPYLNLQMRLGEGSGCPLAFKIIEGACSVMNNMATFEEAQINDDYLEEIRKGDSF